MIFLASFACLHKLPVSFPPLEISLSLFCSRNRQSHLLSDLCVCSFPAQNALSQALRVFHLLLTAASFENDLSSPHSLGILGCYQEITISQDASKQQGFTTHSWEVQDQGTSRFGVWWTLGSCFSGSVFSICPHKGKWNVSFRQGLCYRTTNEGKVSWLHHITRAWPLNSITTGTGFYRWIFRVWGLSNSSLL